MSTWPDAIVAAVFFAFLTALVWLYLHYRR